MGEFLDEASHECALSELELFRVPGTQTGITKRRLVKHYPLTTLGKQSPLEFSIRTSSSECIETDKIWLYTKSRIYNADGSIIAFVTNAEGVVTIPDKAKVAPINYFGNTRFRSIEVFLNNKLVSDSHTLYPYKAILESYLSRSRANIETQLKSGLFEKDTAAKMDESVESFNKNTDTAKRNGNAGLNSRFLKTQQSRLFECLVPLHVDIFNQGKLIVLNNMELKIILRQQSEKFSLMASTNTNDYEIIIDSALLIVPHVEISPPVLEAQKLALSKMNAKFPYTATEMKFFTFGRERSDLSIQNFYTGRVPKKIIFGMVDNSSFTGDLKRNPFNFGNYYINNIALRLDGETLPYENFSMNFEARHTGQAYYSLLDSIGKLTTFDDLIFNQDDFSNGYCIFGFNLKASHGDCYDLVKNGTISLEIKLSRATTESVTLIAYFQFDNLIEITENKTVILS